MEETQNKELLTLIKSLQDEIASLKVKPKKKTKPKKKVVKKTTKKKSTKIKLPSKEEEVQNLEDQTKKAPIFNRKPGAGRAKFESNLWKDDGSLCSKDKLHNAKYGDKFSVQERGMREGAKLIKVNCSMCKREYEIWSSQLSSDYFVCVKCCGGK